MGSESVQIRDAVVDDAAGIARVHVDSWRETYANVLDERYFDEAAYQRRVGMWRNYLRLDSRPGRVAVAVRNGRIIGFASSGKAVGPHAEHGTPASRPLQLFAIYLMADAHGTGIGHALLDAVLGLDPAQLWVLKGNARAIAFYQREGFQMDGVEYTDPSDPDLIELRMVR